MFRRLAIAALAAALWCGVAHAQGCGPLNPNCIVPTAAFGTNNNQAASTAFVQAAIIGGGGLTIGTTSISGGTNGYFLFNNAGILGNYNLFGTSNTWAPVQTFKDVTTSTTPGGITSALSANFFSGNPSTPFTTSQNATVFVGRTEQIAGATADSSAALYVVSNAVGQSSGGASASQTQAVVATAFKDVNSTGDVVALFGRSISVSGSSIGGVFGGFLQAIGTTIHTSPIGIEINTVNGSGVFTAYNPVLPAGPSSIGIDLLYTGTYAASAGVNGTVGLVLRGDGLNNAWDVGIGVLGGAGSISLNSVSKAVLQDDSNATNVFLFNSGAHAYGIRGTGATYSVAALAFPGFTLNGSGTITAGVWNGTTLAVANGGTGITAFGTGVAAALGVNVGSAGAFVTNGGALGTPSSGTATNLTGTAAGLTAGNATNVAITNDTTTNATMFPTWVTANTGSLPLKVSSTEVSFNPSSGVFVLPNLTSTGVANTFAGTIVFNGQQNVGAGPGFSHSTTNKFLIAGGSAGFQRNNQAGNVALELMDDSGHIGFYTNVAGVSSSPALTSCGTSPTISGSDSKGTVTMGTGTPAGCVITFAATYTTVPDCTVTWQTNIASMQYVVSATAITLTQTATSSNKVNYQCQKT